MAENKKSFVLYADLIKSIEHLTNEEKGILFNHLLEYVNDKNPVLQDRLVLTAWKPIEMQLKRDLKKFEEVKSKRSDAGKRSAELRALKLSEQNSTNSTSVESVQQTSTNSTVNVNDTVNVNVNDTVNDIKKNNIVDRKLKFASTLKPFLDFYGKDLINQFYAYWTEPNKSNTKFKQELERTWDLKRRLETWAKNDKNFKTNQNGNSTNNINGNFASTADAKISEYTANVLASVGRKIDSEEPGTSHEDSTFDFTEFKEV